MDTDEHPDWVDDERGPLSNHTRHFDVCEPQRPLWQDVLWGRERGHGQVFEDYAFEEIDLSHYVDFEFDSGCGSQEGDEPAELHESDVLDSDVYFLENDPRLPQTDV